MSVENVQALIRLQDILLSELDELCENATESMNENKSSIHYQIRIHALKELYTKFKDNHYTICQATDNNSTTEYLDQRKYRQFERKYLDIVAQLEEKCAPSISIPNVSTPNFSSTVPSAINTPYRPNIKLPQISLPKFDGTYKSWRTFRDLFKDLIHNNYDISDVEKLHYLKSSVSGEAERLLRPFDVIGNNYTKAWEVLEKRFNNNKILINMQLARLCKATPIKSECVQAMKDVLSNSEEALHELRNLNVVTENWDPILVYLVVQSLPPETRELWEVKQSTSNEPASYKQLTEFLEARFRVLEALTQTNKNKVFLTQHSKGSNQTKKCLKCESSEHKLFRCPVFKKMSLTDRLNFVKRKQLCTNCLSPNHQTKMCPSQFTCNECKGKHHTLLHANRTADKPDTSSTIQTNTTGNPTSPANSTQGNPVKNFLSSNFTQALLSTALVNVRNSKGHYETLRALIDSGSQVSFITASAAKRLKLPLIKARHLVCGLEQSSSTTSNHRTKFCLESTTTTFETKVDALIIKTITNKLPSERIETTGFNHIHGLTLADPQFATPGRIDLLLGAEVYADILYEGIIRPTQPNQPVALNTALGWIIMGKVEDQGQAAKAFMMQVHKSDALDDQLRKFWDQEETQQQTFTKPEDEECEQIFKATTKRLTDGTYQVSLPFKEPHGPELGESRQKAIVQFKALERRFLKDDAYFQMYKQNIHEYLQTGHMIKAATTTSGTSYYMPHHGVMKESSTTKLRTVFNASCPSSNGRSLNEQMHVGPTIQPTLATTLLRWRRYKHAFTADIEKMYRMIHVDPSQHDLQRIVWRDSPADPIQDYAITRVTFGTTSAPFLAIRTIHQLADDECKEFPRASEILKKHMYVDDCCYSHPDIETLIKIQKELRVVLKRGGFHLRKWISNDVRLLENIPDEDRELKESVELNNTFNVKTLGIKWSPTNDHFTFNLRLLNSTKPITKRSILSEIASLFDPFGWLAPCIMTAKLIMQQLWLTRCDWDQRPQEVLVDKWQKFVQELNQVDQIKIPRWLKMTTADTQVSLHGFCDASMKGYAAVIYLVVENTSGHHVSLITSKTKIAPITPVSLPRLELCGATLLARLSSSIRKDLEIENINYYNWTDSTITLAWIQKHPSQWKTFVANRVAEIHELSTPGSWRYIPGKENPADCASRGLMPTDFINNSLWWNGPEWLRKSKEFWPTQPDIPEASTEVRKHKTFMIRQEPDLLIKYSSYNKLLRITALCLRFIHNCQHPNDRRTAHLTTVEISTAETLIVRMVQRTSFAEEYSQLVNKLSVSRKSSIANLNPFLDNQQIIRVGGRLENSKLSYNEKHPMLLPGKHILSQLLIKHVHQQTLHGGVQLVLNTIRSRFWLTNAKNMIRFQLHKCVKCFRTKPSTLTQMMSALPEARVTVSLPFQHVGIDFAGPIDIKVSSLRTAKTKPVYICLFICFSTKAIHLELVSDLSANAFIASFTRFTSRRGLCTDIYSDCGKNFVKTNKILLSKQTEEQLADKLATERITWHFNPPAAPHFGGLWEAGVKLVKTHLTRTLQHTKLTFEELNTVLCKVEACVNSRPLVPLNNDPSSNTFLTPGHFLTGRNIQTLPESSKLAPDTPTRKWQFLKTLQQRFWYVWSKDYLQQLQKRYKWQLPVENLKVGDIVVLKKENLPMMSWPLGKITRIFSGKDNLIRTVEVQVAGKTYLRPIVKICKLPINDIVDE